MSILPGKKDLTTLLPGLLYAQKYGLTQREITVLMCLMEKSRTQKEIAYKTKIHEKTLQKFIQNLRLKKLVSIMDRDPKHNNVYEFNSNSL